MADGLLLFLGGLAFLGGVGLVVYQTVYRNDMLREYRRANARAVGERFGPGHVRLTTQEHEVGRQNLVGLREVILLEDENHERWQVTVESLAGGQTELHAKAVDPVGEAVRSAQRNIA